MRDIKKIHNACSKLIAKAQGNIIDALVTSLLLILSKFYTLILMILLMTLSIFVSDNFIVFDHVTLS